MTSFFDTSSPLQIFLLILSQSAVISLSAAVVVAFKRGFRFYKRIGLCLTLAVNVVLYVIMQLESRITGAEQLHVRVPYIALLVFIIMSCGYTVWVVVIETRKRKAINHTSIKEAFDNLPTGVCFFNEAGLPVLCNRAMHRFGFAVCGKDIQFITDLEACFDESFKPTPEAERYGLVFVLRGGRAWHLEKRDFAYEDGAIYTQYIAQDVTALHGTRMELTRDNEQLRRVQADLKLLSANIVAVTREEEILNAKMRVHDEMGRCLTAAKMYLTQERDEDIPENVIASWQRAVSMLKYNNDTPDEDMLSQIRAACESLNLNYRQTGELPSEEGVAYILTCAVRECVTNAVRYAAAGVLYADFSQTDGEASVTVTNNGTPPEKEIKEGGGLSTLRRRVERAGGVMTVYSLPRFKLVVTVPKGKVDVI